MMDRLRSRERMFFNGFTKTETDKMEKLLRESGEESLDKEFCHKLSRNFNRSSDRAGKPVIRWTEVQSWFQSRVHDCPSKVMSSPSTSEKLSTPTEVIPPSKKSNKNLQPQKGEKVSEIKEQEFEARSTKDGAWYDVDMFLAHRFISSGEAEVRIRFVGFGAEEDEWINIKEAVRERSRPLESTECGNINVGDLVLCFREKRDQALHFDAHVLEIQRRRHDIRGCRCLFLVCYDHDNIEENVRLRRLSCRPT